jgi:hypothetical protein
MAGTPRKKKMAQEEQKRKAEQKEKFEVNRPLQR